MGLTDFGKVVKKKLIDKDMTQAQLAAMIGCGNQYLHKILVGERSGDKYKEAISVILEIDLDKVKAAGYDTSTLVVICNTDDYGDVRGLDNKEVQPGDDVIVITK